MHAREPRSDNTASPRPGGSRALALNGPARASSAGRAGSMCPPRCQHLRALPWRHNACRSRSGPHTKSRSALSCGAPTARSAAPNSILPCQSRRIVTRTRRLSPSLRRARCGERPTACGRRGRRRPPATPITPPRPGGRAASSARPAPAILQPSSFATRTARSFRPPRVARWGGGIAISRRARAGHAPSLQISTERINCLRKAMSRHRLTAMRCALRPYRRGHAVDASSIAARRPGRSARNACARAAGARRPLRRVPFGNSVQFVEASSALAKPRHHRLVIRAVGG